ncbi:hypothetical protein Q777_GL002208 [Lacticaseibacillus rhamnosus DSM 20021 = JCM 1136 = NBRC 3425]|nr:hypothetical protein Q777_GL002208 [Lacticaseibacillus rhamnosus DSM 20021 = JCM 1136 = NBRC 3425]
MATFNLVTVNPTKQDTNVIAGFTKIQGLTEHFKTGNGGFENIWLQTDDFNFIADLNRTTIDTTRSNGTTTSNGEDIFNRHQERLVGFTNWGWDIFIDGIHQFHDNLFLFRIAFKCFQGRTAENRNIITRIIVFAEQFPNFHFNQVDQFWIINQVSLVQENNDVINTNLTRQQNMFTCLWHWAISCSNDQNRTVHLGSTGDHVLNVVSMPWRINMCVVALFRFIFNVGGVDGDTTFFFFWSSINRSIVLRLGKAFLRQYLGDSRGQSSFTVVNVPDRTNVYVGLCAFIVFFFSHEKTNLLYFS